MTAADFLRGALVNLAVLFALVTLSGMVRSWLFTRRLSIGPWPRGVLFGVMAMVAMMVPVAAGEGLIFDCRAAVIGTAGLLCGPLAALASLPLPLLYRLHVGGLGLVPGLLEIVLPAVFGSLCHVWLRRRGRELTFIRLVGASVLVAAATNVPILLLVLCFLPEAAPSTEGFQNAMVVANTPISMVLLGALILLEQRHYEAVDAQTDSERRMRHSQKMAAIGQLAQKLAHTFTNSLTAILGNAEFVKKRVADRPDVGSALDDVVDTVGRLSKLTGELLAFAHPAPLRMQRLDLGKALVGIREILTKSLGPGVEVVIEARDAPVTVDMDPDQIAQAVLHMAVNAEEAMAGHGRLSLATSRADLSARQLQRFQPELREQDRHAGEFAVLTVRDTGCGMTEEVSSRIFEPFYTTKEAERNEGLGLATVYNIVRQHRGVIDVESSPGRGTVFHVYLPLAA